MHWADRSAFITVAASRSLGHAFYGANAFFDPNCNAVFFGYFKASALNPGPNLPGQMVFTCLSHGRWCRYPKRYAAFRQAVLGDAAWIRRRQHNYRHVSDDFGGFLNSARKHARTRRLYLPQWLSSCRNDKDLVISANAPRRHCRLSRFRAARCFGAGLGLQRCQSRSDPPWRFGVLQGQAIFCQKRGCREQQRRRAGNAIDRRTSTRRSSDSPHRGSRKQTPPTSIGGSDLAFRHPEAGCESRTVRLCLQWRIPSGRAGTGRRRARRDWDACIPLAKNYPKIDVDPDALYVVDGRLWTSAGVTTGIDMTLAMVAQDFDAAIAGDVAKRLVLYARRPG